MLFLHNRWIPMWIWLFFECLQSWNRGVHGRTGPEIEMMYIQACPNFRVARARSG